MNKSCEKCIGKEICFLDSPCEFYLEEEENPEYKKIQEEADSKAKELYQKIIREGEKMLDDISIDLGVVDKPKSEAAPKEEELMEAPPSALDVGIEIADDLIKEEKPQEEQAQEAKELELPKEETEQKPESVTKPLEEVQEKIQEEVLEEQKQKPVIPKPKKDRQEIKISVEGLPKCPCKNPSPPKEPIQALISVLDVLSSSELPKKNSLTSKILNAFADYIQELEDHGL